MRVQILALAAFSVTGLAHAASIDSIKTGLNGATKSIEVIRCATCVKVAKENAGPVVPELAPGTQKVEIRNIGGVMKVYRTEAWLGGSPVVVVTNASEGEIAKQVTVAPTEKAAVKIDQMPVEQPVIRDAEMIDESATTSAVTADMGASMKIEPKTAAFDAGKLEFRLD